VFSAYFDAAGAVAVAAFGQIVALPGLVIRIVSTPILNFCALDLKTLFIPSSAVI
jgi:hypothetical protein